MNKATKGAMAAGLGVAMLVGGAGTLAYWNDADTVDGGTINSGHLNLVKDLTNTGCTAWTLDNGEDPATTYTDGDPLVPGDVLSEDCAFTIQAVGNHLRATVGISSPNFSGTNGDFGTKLVPSVSALKVNGIPVTEITDADDGKALTVTVSVTFDGSADNTTEDMSTVLDNLTVTTSQVHN